MIGPESTPSVHRIVVGIAESLKSITRLDNHACRSGFVSPVRALRCNNPPLEDEPVGVREAEKRAEVMEVRPNQKSRRFVLTISHSHAGNR